MSKIIDLSGKWELFGTYEDGRELHLPATVPGCVHTDLIDNGVFENIYYRDNSKYTQWVENRDFTYKRIFEVGKLLPSAFLEFDGLDTYSEVFLNGTKIGDTDDMFIPYEFPVDGVLKAGVNTLEVRFRSPIKEIEGLPLRKGAFTRERMNTRRMQCTYSWDWVDRFVTMGVFRPVRLSFRENNEIDNIYVFTKDIDSHSAQIKLEVAFRNFAESSDKVHIEIKSPSGKVIFEKDRAILKDNLYEYIDIRNPELWYPNGYGAQPLYTLTVSTPTSRKVQKVGIRKIKVLQLEDEAGSREAEICSWLQSLEYTKDRDFNEKTASFAVIVNGIRIMCKGGNWVPCEPFPSAEAPEKITQILERSVDMGVNMVRVWGGGIFERDEFYDECDRLGILVTQDFLMACGSYPEEEEWFIKALNREATAAALRLRNHACLTFWSGDNENAEFGSENLTDFPGYRSATYGIEPIITKLDPERYFFPSSPYGGDRYSSVTRGTTHNTNFVWYQFQHVEGTDMSDYREFLTSFLSRFCAEQAAFGMSFPSSLEKYLDKEDIYGTDDTMLEYHTKGNPDFKNMTLYGYIAMMAEKIFGKYEGCADIVKKQAMLHCEWVRLSFELYRSNKGFSSGLIYWMLNDCWPAASGWAFIDYYTCPKPAYYVFKRCAAPVVSALAERNGVFTLHISNDSLEEVEGKADIYVYDTAAGTEKPFTSVDFKVGPNSAECVFKTEYDKISGMMNESSIVMCDMTSNLGEDRTILVPKRYVDLGIAYEDVKIVSETENEITVTADGFIPYAMIDVPYLLSENCFPLKRGETKTVKKLKKL